ncbi:unnamed protein product [Rhizopus stolonifer]
MNNSPIENESALFSDDTEHSDTSNYDDVKLFDTSDYENASPFTSDESVYFSDTELSQTQYEEMDIDPEEEFPSYEECEENEGYDDPMDLDLEMEEDYDDPMEIDDPMDVDFPLEFTGGWRFFLVKGWKGSKKHDNGIWATCTSSLRAIHVVVLNLAYLLQPKTLNSKAILWHPKLRLVYWAHVVYTTDLHKTSVLRMWIWKVTMLVFLGLNTSSSAEVDLRK